MNFDWIVEGQVGAMARPQPGELAALAELGVRGVLSLSESVPHGLPVPGIEHLHVPVADLEPPELDDLRRAVDFVERVVASGGACVVHCDAGLGRTGTVVAAWLVRRGADPTRAIEEVRRRRPGSVETPEQAAAVRTYAAGLRSASGVEGSPPGGDGRPEAPP